MKSASTDTDPHLDQTPVTCGLQLEIVDSKTELVETIDSLSYLEGLVGADREIVVELGPQAFVAFGDILAELEVGLFKIAVARSCDIRHFSGNVFDHDRQVLVALSSRQLAVEAGRLGIDHDCLDDTGIPPVEQIRQRTVAPIEPCDVKFDQEARDRIEHVITTLAKPGAIDETPIRERVADIAGYHRTRLLTVRVEPRTSDPTRRAG